jgi:potassium channel subfamily K
VGYGDYSFSTQTGRFVSIFYMMISVLTTSNFVAGISGYIIDAKQQQLIQRSLNRKLRISDILEMDEDSDGEVDKLEFLTKMLVRLRKCEQDDIDEILQRFDDLDIDGSGALDMKDILLGGNQAV